MLAGPATGKVASFFGRKVSYQASGVALASGSVKLTGALIKRSLANAQYVTRQKNVSIPKIEIFVRDMLNGDKFPPIKVDGDVIVEGHHRYIASKIAKVDIDVDPGHAPNFMKKDLTRRLSDMNFSDLDY